MSSDVDGDDDDDNLQYEIISTMADKNKFSTTAKKKNIKFAPNS